MGLIRWFTRNWADTTETTHHDIRPIDIELPLPEAFEKVRAAIGKLRLWRIEACDPAAGTIHATRRTRVWRFVDDIHLRLEPTPTGVRLQARSKSRIGVGDLGQNRRNLLELFRSLHQELGKV